jgi:hypothetical protein
MGIILNRELTGSSVWAGRDLAQDESWIHHLDDSAILEIESALLCAKNSALATEALTVTDFPLHYFSEQLRGFAEELENGRGFLLLRGLPVERYSEDDIRTIYYGIGLHLGSPVRQNPKGDLLGLVMHVGDVNDKQTRVYETNLYLPYHTDPSDVVGLLCLRRAKSGGMSSLVSSASIYNEIVRHHSEFLALFYRPFYYAHLGENEPGLSPIFSFNNGKLSCRYLRQYIELGHEMMSLPLSRIEVEALDIFDSIMQNDKLRLDMMLQPGDLQFANNYMVMHSRTEFQDYDEIELRRKMLRLWLKMPNARPLAAEFPGRNGFPPPPA